SSTASNAPVEAPLGAAARAWVPSSSATSTSIVGLPRESRICLAWMASMVAKTAPGDVSGFRYWSLAEQWRAVAAATPRGTPTCPAVRAAAPATPHRRRPHRHNPHRGRPHRTPSVGVAVLFLRPPPDPVPVAPRGGAQLQLGVEAGRARLGHKGEQRRPDLAD